jgi:hypothetical protein
VLGDLGTFLLGVAAIATLVLQVATMRSGFKAASLNAQRLQGSELPARGGTILVARLQNGRSLSASDVLDITAAAADALGIRLSPATLESTLRRVLRSAVLTTEEAIALDHNEKERITATLRHLMEDVPDLVSGEEALSSTELMLGTLLLAFWALAVLQVIGVVDLPIPSLVWIGGGGVILLVVVRIWFHTVQNREPSRHDISALAEADEVGDVLTLDPTSLRVMWR